MKSRSVFFVLLGIAAVLAFFIWRFQHQRDKFEWSDSMLKKSYSEASDQPYGTQILHRLLANYFPGKRLTDLKKNVADELPLDSSGRSSYVFIGEAMFMDSLDVQRLIAFVDTGNTALISSKTIQNDLMATLYFPECGEAAWDDYDFFWDTAQVRISLVSPPNAAPPGLPFFYARQNRPMVYRWHFIGSPFLCGENGFAPLGHLNDSLVNFVEVPFGHGRFLLHTNPVAFSNFHLLRPEGKAYLAGVLSHLPSGDVFWDVHSRTTEAVGRRRNELGGNSRRLPDEHALTYILKQPALAWAWYLLLLIAATWLVFRAKRRQRVIPVLAKNENSSLEFISAIANLHFREQDFRRLCQQKMRLFLAQLRERYGLAASLDPDSDLPRMDGTFLPRLAQMAALPEAQLRDIFEQYTACARFEPTETMMTDLHLAIENFWKKAR